MCCTSALWCDTLHFVLHILIPPCNTLQHNSIFQGNLFYRFLTIFQFSFYTPKHYSFYTLLTISYFNFHIIRLNIIHSTHFSPHFSFPITHPNIIHSTHFSSYLYFSTPPCDLLQYTSFHIPLFHYTFVQLITIHLTAYFNYASAQLRLRLFAFLTVFQCSHHFPIHLLVIYYNTSDFIFQFSLRLHVVHSANFSKSLNFTSHVSEISYNTFHFIFQYTLPILVIHSTHFIPYFNFPRLGIIYCNTFHFMPQFFISSPHNSFHSFHFIFQYPLREGHSTDGFSIKFRGGRGAEFHEYVKIKQIFVEKRFLSIRKQLTRILRLRQNNDFRIKKTCS